MGKERDGICPGGGGNVYLRGTEGICGKLSALSAGIYETSGGYGKGDPKAPVMFVAEAPGNHEDMDGVPFTGRSGELLDQLLSGAGMSREEIYLTNVVKCHPPGNRDPKPEEQEQCMPYLKYETWLVKPKIIVCLGRIAAQRIIRPDYRITREHGTFVYRKNTYLTAVYHPSAVLRDMGKWEETLRDFRAIREKRDELAE